MFWVTRSYDTYTVGKPTRIQVLDKINTNAAYRVPSKFLLIVKNEEGRVFDLNVSPSTYSQTKIGEYKTFNISGQDMEITGRGFFIYVFPSLILLGSAFASFIVLLINIFVEDNKQY